MKRERSLSQSWPLVVMLAGALLLLGASLPAGLLPVALTSLARRALAQLGFLHAFDVVFSPDSPGYVDFDFSKGVLDNYRTMGYPLFLKAVAWLSPDYQFLPFAQNLLHAVAVLVFWHGLRRAGFTGWTATLTAIPLYFVRTVESFGHWVLTDAPGLSLALATLGVMLIAVSSPARARWWGCLAGVTFLTYMTRPAYLFLIGLVPVLGALVAWLQRPGAADLRRTVIGLVASCLAPFLLYGALRWWAVGHFGVVSAGGVNAIGIAVEMLDADLCRNLPHQLRPMALRAAQERDRWLWPYRCVTRRSIDLSAAENAFCYNVVWVGFPLTTAICGTEAMPVLNRRLSEFSSAVFLRSPAAYALWIAFSFARDVFGILRWLQWELLGLAGLGMMASVLSWLTQRERRDRGFRRFVPTGLSVRELGILSLVGLGFYGASLLLVVMVEPPISRYTDASHLFLPSLIAYGFIVAARSVWRSVVMLAGAGCATATAPDMAAAPDVGRTASQAGRNRRRAWWATGLGLAAVMAWLGWIALSGWQDRLDRFLSAVQRGDMEQITRMLEQNAGLARQCSASGVSALHVAAIDGQQSAAKLLLQRGADVGATDRDGLTPLHWAAVAGQAAVMDELLAQGADPNAASKGGILPIHLARTAAEANALVKHGARLDVADQRGLGPLHWVLDPDAATALVKAGADPNRLQRDRAGVRVSPALQHAIRKFNGPLGKRLLELGADPNLRDAQGQTALFASLEAWRTLLDELLAHRANPLLTVDVSGMSQWRLRIAGVTSFLDPADDMTVLHWATLLDHPDTVKKLAASVHDVNIKSRLGLTPLHWAAAANKPQAVLALLACGADPSIKNNAGQTAADLAAKAGNDSIVRTLHDAKPAAKAPAEGRP